MQTVRDQGALPHVLRSNNHGKIGRGPFCCRRPEDGRVGRCHRPPFASFFKPSTSSRKRNNGIGMQGNAPGIFPIAKKITVEKSSSKRLSGLTFRWEKVVMPILQNPTSSPIMPHTLPALDYSTDALEPHFDSRTMEIHHGKHHQTYVQSIF